jgi:hypothetical protein
LLALPAEQADSADPLGAFGEEPAAPFIVGILSPLGLKAPLTCGTSRFLSIAVTLLCVT